MRITKTVQIPNQSYYHEERLSLYGIDKPYDWTIAQWSSKYDLFGDDEITGGHNLETSEDGLVHTITSKGREINGEYKPAKKMIFNTKDGSVYLELNGTVEYETPRTSSDPWAHLLVQDDFDKVEKYHITSKTSIIAETEFTLEKFVDGMGDKANPGMHAAQLVWYILLRNNNEKSEDYRHAIWFGLPLWDNRNQGQGYDSASMYDVGTGTLIVSPSSDDVYSSTKGIVPSIGDTAKVSVDVLPLITEAFVVAKRQGYLVNTNFEDLYIAHTNFGFEMPGSYDLGVKFKSINYFAK